MRSIRSALTACFCAVGFAASPVAAPPAMAPVQGKGDLDQPQRVKDWGYSIRPIKEWNSIPADQGDKYVVGRWKPNLDGFRLRGDYEGFNSGQYCELTIVRIPLMVATTGEADPAKPESADKEPEKEQPASATIAALEKRYNPRTLNDFIEGRYEGAAKRWTSKEIKAGKLKGTVLQFGSGAEAITIGTFQGPGAEWAVVYTAFEETYRKTWQDIYLKSIESFSLFEPEGTAATGTVNLDPSKLEGEAKRAALQASIAGNPGWYAIDTPSYVFLSNSENRGFIKTLAKEVELVREKVYLKMFPPRNTKESISPVRVLDTEMEYYQYGGPPGSAGYFSPSSGELVLYTKSMDASKAESAANCRSVAYHEAFHQYVHFAIGDVAPHSWFNEGHGDYFAGIVINGSNIKFTPFDWRVDFLKDHLRGDRDLIPLRTLVRLPQSEYYTNGGLKYSEGWALIYFLRNVTKDKRNQEILDIYFRYVVDNVEAFRNKKKEKKEGEPEPEPVPGIPGMMVFDFEDHEKVEKILSEAVDKAFDGVDMEALDKEFRTWVERL